MQYKLAFLFALVVICSQAATLNYTNSTALYAIDTKRYDTLIARMKATNETQHKTYHLMNAMGSFAFTCEQLISLFRTYFYQYEVLEIMPLLKNNVIDPKNYNTALIVFGDDTNNRQSAIKIFSSMTPCTVQGVAPEKFPVPALPYKDQWKQADIESLIKSINRVYNSDEKLRLAQNAMTSTSNLLSSDQALLLYDSFSSVPDMLSLTELIKERIVGLSCDQVIAILTRFYFDDMKLQALEAFKQDIIDVENKLSILDAFRLPKTQALASKILLDLKPKNYLFGNPTGNVLFLIDVSGSMDTTFTLSTGQKMSRLDFVKTEIAKTLNSLNESSQFNVVSYARGINIWRGFGLQKATKDNIASAVNFTNNLVAYDGTNIHSTLQLAWLMNGVNTIYLLTDGFPNDGVTDISKIITDVRTWYAKTPIKINSIAFLMGTDSSDDKPTSKRLMSALADATSGSYRVLESDK